MGLDGSLCLLKKQGVKRIQCKMKLLILGGTGDVGMWDSNPLISPHAPVILPCKYLSDIKSEITMY